MFNKEPKPIKVTKNEAEAFQQLADEKTALERMLASYGLMERLLWDGLKKKYRINTLKFRWSYNMEKKTIEISHLYPDWAKDRLMK